MKKLKVITIVGTRPEIIKLSRVIPSLDSFTNHILINTKQNYTKNLNELFFKELRLRKPDYTLHLEGMPTLASQIGRIFVGIEKVFMQEKPDAVLVLGDTNSCLSTIMAKRMKIPIFHMEAGNRCFDENVPEEINRRIIDHISDINLAYTEQSRLNLLGEGLHAGRIYVTGSPMAEVLTHYLPDINASSMLSKHKLTPQKYIVVSLHREENVDDEHVLRRILKAIVDIDARSSLPVIFSVHPRTKDRISHFRIPLSKKIVYLDAFGFFDYCQLQKHAYCVLSDSGTIQEESAILRFPAVQLRNSSERPEAFDQGTIVLSGHNPESIISGMDVAVRGFHADRSIPSAYTQMNVSEKVVKLIIGLGSVMRQNLSDFNRRLF